MLRHLPAPTDADVLTSIGDDSVVYRIDENRATVQSLDVITPVVDDPFTFGAIAAANALSDLYAVGATPAFSLNFAAFPVKSLPLSILEQILAGGAEKASEAGATVLGGHTIDDPSPKYGLAVTGFVTTDQLILKSGARPGDRIFLTKPIGTGALTTAFINGQVEEEDLDLAIGVMSELNRSASKAMLKVGVHACTDVTGFGLIGHLDSLCRMSGVGARLWIDRIPLLEGAHEAILSGSLSEGGQNNWRALRDHVVWADHTDRATRQLLCDPQTSGGLLICVSPEKANTLRKALQESKCLAAAEIGEISADANQLSVE